MTRRGPENEPHRPRPQPVDQGVLPASTRWIVLLALVLITSIVVVAALTRSPSAVVGAVAINVTIGLLIKGELRCRELESATRLQMEAARTLVSDFRPTKEAITVPGQPLP